MCAGPLAITTTAISAVSAISSYRGQRQAAADQNAYNAAVEAQQRVYQRQLMQYNNEAYAREIDYYGDLLDYQQQEFQRQADFVMASQEAINKDYFNKFSTLLTRQVEEAMATAFGIETAERQARWERATARAAAAERGVEGNSVEAILNDVSRQQGEAVAMMRLNQEAVSRQLMLEAMGLKAAADTALNNIPVNVFQPITPPTPPAPESPVTPAPVVRGPSGMSLIGNLAGSVIGGVNNYLNWSPDRATALETLRSAIRL